MTAAPPVHDLLLALAGRLDDDLLAWARELLAVGEEDQAVELATAALAAERVVLPPTLRVALVAAARAAHTDLDVESALAGGTAEEGTRHRFDAAAAPGDAVCGVLTALPARRLAGCTLHLTWRTTPAGAAPGPLPRAVVLVEADPERSTDVLAYLLATELDRAGAPASVEVFTAGRPLPAYHTAAMRSARTVLRGTVEVLGHSAERSEAGRPGEGGGTSLFLVPGAPSGSDAGQPEATPAATGSRVAEPSRPDGIRPDEAAEPRLPTGRRRRPEPIAPAGVPTDGGISGPPPPAAPPLLLPGTVEPAPDTDPFHGPLQMPLLAPLLEPTGAEPGGRDAAGPDSLAARRDTVPTGTAAPAPGQPDIERAAPAEPDAPPVTPEAPVPAPGPAAVPAEWEEEWRSGEWAMPHTPRPDRTGPDDAFGAPGGTDPAVPDLPRRSERTERLRRHTAADGSGIMPPVRSDGAPAAGSSLFESPTARVAPGPAPRPQEDESRRGGPSSDSGQRPAAPTGLPFHNLTGDGQTPRDRPRNERPAVDDPLFGPKAPDVPLFGGEPGPNGRTPEAPRPGRRRRPDSPPDTPSPFPAADPDRVPAPSRPADDPPPALLDGTEGDLLAQLQAELAARERRPRPYRRADRNGSTVNGNGHAPDGDRPPPDLAG